MQHFSEITNYPPPYPPPYPAPYPEPPQFRRILEPVNVPFFSWQLRSACGRSPRSEDEVPCGDGGVFAGKNRFFHLFLFLVFPSRVLNVRQFHKVSVFDFYKVESSAQFRFCRLCRSIPPHNPTTPPTPTNPPCQGRSRRVSSRAVTSWARAGLKLDETAASPFRAKCLLRDSFFTVRIRLRTNRILRGELLPNIHAECRKLYSKI